jgi:hypothetical protein
VDPFLFYVLCEVDSDGYHMVRGPGRCEHATTGHLQLSASHNVMLHVQSPRMASGVLTGAAMVSCRCTVMVSAQVGYFSKEKSCQDNYNLACILTLPAYQRKVSRQRQRRRNTGYLYPACACAPLAAAVSSAGARKPCSFARITCLESCASPMWSLHGLHASCCCVRGPCDCFNCAVCTTAVICTVACKDCLTALASALGSADVTAVAFLYVVTAS